MNVSLHNVSTVAWLVSSISWLDCTVAWLQSTDFWPDVNLSLTCKVSLGRDKHSRFPILFLLMNCVCSKTSNKLLKTVKKLQWKQSKDYQSFYQKTLSKGFIRAIKKLQWIRFFFQKKYFHSLHILNSDIKLWLFKKSYWILNVLWKMFVYKRKKLYLQRKKIIHLCFWKDFEINVSFKKVNPMS